MNVRKSKGRNSAPFPCPIVEGALANLGVLVLDDLRGVDSQVEEGAAPEMPMQAGVYAIDYRKERATSDETD